MPQSPHDELREQIRRSARDFVDREIMPIADALDREEKPIPQELIEKVGELGYLGIAFPEEHGGLGLDTVTLAIVTEELARGWLSVGSILTRAVIAGTLILAHGTEEQKKRLLPAIASGEILTAAS